MNLVDVKPFDELVLLINNLSDEKSKRILLSKAAEVYGYGGKAHIVSLTGMELSRKVQSGNTQNLKYADIRQHGESAARLFLMPQEGDRLH